MRYRYSLHRKLIASGRYTYKCKCFCFSAKTTYPQREKMRAILLVSHVNMLRALVEKRKKRFKMKFIHKMELIRTKLNALRQKRGAHARKHITMTKTTNVGCTCTGNSGSKINIILVVFDKRIVYVHHHCPRALFLATHFAHVLTM